MPMFSPNALKGIAIDFYSTCLSMKAPFLKIVRGMSRLFNSEHLQRQLHSQMQTAKLEMFMKERKHDPLSDGSDALVAGMNCIVLQEPD